MLSLDNSSEAFCVSLRHETNEDNHILFTRKEMRGVTRRRLCMVGTSEPRHRRDATHIFFGVLANYNVGNVNAGAEGDGDAQHRATVTGTDDETQT